MAVNLSSLPEGVKKGPELDKAKADANEQKAKIDMPKDLRSALEQSNGMSIKTEGGKIVFLPHQKVLTLWKGFNETYTDGKTDDKKAVPDSGVAATWWNPAWIPFAKINGADYYCIDQAPAAGGRRGQIILFRTGKPKRQIIAKSLEEFISMVLSKIK
jgi:cell wall assembly regulator SMI1